MSDGQWKKECRCSSLRKCRKKGVRGTNARTEYDANERGRVEGGINTRHENRLNLGFEIEYRLNY